MDNIDSELIRETYAQFGLCVYHLQCIERAVSICIAQNIIKGRNITNSQYDYILSQLIEKTLGQLKAIIDTKNIKLLSSINDQFDYILNKRNYIIHDY